MDIGCRDWLLLVLWGGHPLTVETDCYWYCGAVTRCLLTAIGTVGGCPLTAIGFVGRLSTGSVGRLPADCYWCCGAVAR